MSEEKAPEDLGVKVKSKKQILWEKVKNRCVISIEQCEDEMEIQNELMAIADKKISEEQCTQSLSPTVAATG